MSSLSELSNGSRGFKRRKRVGRGPSSGMGKTCGRGVKGAGARSGYKRRHTYEGGQKRLFQSLPQRGFSNERFRVAYRTLNLSDIERLYNEGETVTLETLKQRGFLSKGPVKLLGKGELTKKVASIEVDAASRSAIAAVEKVGISLKVIAG